MKNVRTCWQACVARAVSVGRYVLCRYLVTASLEGQRKVVSFVLRLGTVNKPTIQGQIIVVAVVYSC